jgi:hypothetical protein
MKTEKERKLADGMGGGGWGGAKKYDGEKAWSFINHYILSVEEVMPHHLICSDFGFFLI